MLKNSSKMIFFLMIFFSTLIIISSSSWLNSWMGLEINLISFISFILTNKKPYSIEASIVYFLIQSMASILFLFSVIFYMKFLNLSFKLFNVFNMLMMSALLMKIGTAPLHFWLPLIMQKLNWMNNYILMTWQKLGPMILISNSWNQKFLTLFIISSMIIGSLGGFNQTSLKKMMAFSSINQISWLLVSLMLSKYLWMIYYLFYFYILMNLLMIFNKLNIMFIHQLMNLKFKNFYFLFIFLNVMSMGGLPPFLGFMPKLMIIMNMNNKMLMFLLIMFTLITLYYYLRIMYFIIFMNNFKKKKMNKTITNMNLIFQFSFFSNFMLMIIILI